MKKLLVFLVMCICCLSINAKAIYYPMYVCNIEVYHCDSLVLSRNILSQNTVTLPMYQKDCNIIVQAPGNIEEFVKKSVSARRAANWAGVAGVLNAAAGVYNAGKGISSHGIDATFYLSNSYFFTTQALENFRFMKYCKEVSKDFLVLPVTCSVYNQSNKILRGNYIVKPDEKINLTNTNYVDEWRFSDNENNVYCIRMMAIIIRDKGTINPVDKIAYSTADRLDSVGNPLAKYLENEELTYKQKFELNRKMKEYAENYSICRIDLKTYEVTRISKTDSTYIADKHKKFDNIYYWGN